MPSGRAPQEAALEALQDELPPPAQERAGALFFFVLLLSVIICHSLSYVYACKPTGQVPHAPGRFKSPVGGEQHTICNMHILYCKMMGSAGKSWVLFKAADSPRRAAI